MLGPARARDTTPPGTSPRSPHGAFGGTGGEGTQRARHRVRRIAVVRLKHLRRLLSATSGRSAMSGLGVPIRGVFRRWLPCSTMAYSSQPVLDDRRSDVIGQTKRTDRVV